MKYGPTGYCDSESSNSFRQSRTKLQPDDVNSIVTPSYNIPGSESKVRRGPSPSSTFPAKLHEILSCPEYSHIITWMPHGRAWRVLNPKEFAEIVMPKKFSHQSKYSSFKRQVNGWGFKRFTHGPDRNSYFHNLFLRDKPQLIQRMMRISASASKKVSSISELDDKEPNFYEDLNIPRHPPRGTPDSHQVSGGNHKSSNYAYYHPSSYMHQPHPFNYPNDFYDYKQYPRELTPPSNNAPFYQHYYHPSYNYSAPSENGYSQQPQYSQYTHYPEQNTELYDQYGAGTASYQVGAQQNVSSGSDSWKNNDYSTPPSHTVDLETIIKEDQLSHNPHLYS